MFFHEYVSEAVQAEARRVGERDRLLLEVRRTRAARRERVISAAPAGRLVRLLLRRGPLRSAAGGLRRATQPPATRARLRN